MGLRAGIGVLLDLGGFGVDIVSTAESPDISDFPVGYTLTIEYILIPLSSSYI